MNLFFKSLKPAFLCIVCLTILLGILYPVFMWGVGHLIFTKKANGSLFFYENGQPLGSEWIAQDFTKPGYFHPRPSNAGNGYDAANSSGSNLGPTSQKLIDTLKKNVANFRSENELGSDVLVPADAVCSSASGLDPHISVENAFLQASRIASARELEEKAIRNLIQEYTEEPDLSIFGEKRINVLRINLALDKLYMESHEQ